jgi:hypothetical protein
MIEQIKYINHRNETLDFGAEGMFINKNDLRDFDWKIVSKNNRITGFKKGVVAKTIPVIISTLSEEECKAKQNALYEVCEKDVLAVKHGRLVIGDYYMKCFVTTSKKKDYLKSRQYKSVQIKISTDMPYWVKETITTFGYGAGAAGSNLDFNNDFPYDYTSNIMNQKLNNTGFVPENFRMNIYGPCINPQITIGGHVYEVAKEFEANEYLTIDSIAKTITLTHTDGAVENCFNLRNKESYIFEKIPVGVNTVSGNAEFKFDITLFEERGEPKWT